MFRRIATFAVLVAVLIGCSKKNDATPPDGEVSDPNATYELNYPALRRGDKHEIVRSHSATATIKTPNSTQTKKDEFRYEFTETILDTAPAESKPTKVTRVYKTAQKTDAKGEAKPASYIGKTITIERYQQGYTYGVDGHPLPPAERDEISKDFNRGRWKLDRTFPKKAVKVGEEWQVDFAAITAIAGKPQDAYDEQKSKITGKLVRAYRKDGQQWGLIEVKIARVFAPPARGTSESAVTCDIAIDGPVQAGTLKITTKGSVEARDMLGNLVNTTIEATEEQSITPVK